MSVLTNIGPDYCTKFNVVLIKSIAIKEQDNIIMLLLLLIDHQLVYSPLYNAITMTILTEVTMYIDDACCRCL